MTLKRFIVSAAVATVVTAGNGRPGHGAGQTANSGDYES